MRPLLMPVLLGAVLWGAIAPVVGDEITAQQVRQAIDRGIGFLRGKQKADGSWTELTGLSGGVAYPGGVTSLCALALMEAGVPPTDPAVHRALAYIRTIEPEENYVLALQTMALARAGEKGDLATIRRNVGHLERNQQHQGQGSGGWGYLDSRDRVDNSNTQFAMLALYEAEQAGIEVSPETWQESLAYWERVKNGPGSWGYRPGDPSTGSMTSAGISSIIIASGSVNPADARADNSGCHCTEHEQSETVENALSWLGEHYSVARNPEGHQDRLGIGGPRADMWHYYYLYALERAGRLSARRFLIRKGPPPDFHDWYREGADYLVRHQDAAGSGSWTGKPLAENVEHISTSLALLFLSKGRRPVLVSKLQRPGNDWNLLRHDLAHLTAYAEKKWKLPMTWQIINGRTATLSDYHQTPVLFLSGREPLHFDNDAQKQLLRAYVEEGGFIYADVCCQGGEFEKSFRDLMREIFPEPQLQLKPLEPDHPIWSIEEKVDSKYIHPETRWLYGIDVGCRTSVVMSTGNLSCYWELDRGGRGEKLPEAVASEMAACRALGINVLAYATNRRPPTKDAIEREIHMGDTKTTTARGHLAIAKLRHAGGCDDAPRALSNLMEALAHSLQMRVDTHPPLLDITDESLFNFHLVYMQGRNDFRLNLKEVEQLRTFLQRGGMILSDSLCASPAFAEAFRREMKRVLPGQALSSIPVGDPIFSPFYGGMDVTHVTRREAVERRRQGEPLEIKLREGVEPVLLGIKVGERYAVIFSPYDISCALERQAAPQCRGYTSEDATRIAINVILYSLHN